VCVCVCTSDLLQTWDRSYRNIQNIGSSFYRADSGKNRVSEWLFKFKRSVTSVEDSERSGCPSTGKTDEDVEQVKELLLKNRRNTIHSVADMFRILLRSVQSNWGTANTCHVDPKFMPAPLPLPRVRCTRDRQCVNMCQECRAREA